MSKLKPIQAQAVLAQPETGSALPTQHPIAVYYRQSTGAQIGNISTSIQTVDMVKYLQNLGWAERNIIMIDMDGGVSGSLKIDERPGMKRLFDHITEGKVRAVACQDEDRLQVHAKAAKVSCEEEGDEAGEERVPTGGTVNPKQRGASATSSATVAVRRPEGPGSAKAHSSNDGLGSAVLRHHIRRIR